MILTSLQHEDFNGLVVRFDKPILWYPGASIDSVLGNPIHHPTHRRHHLNDQIRRTNHLLCLYSIQMSIQHDENIRLKHILWPQDHINRAHEHSPETSEFDTSSQTGINFTNDVLMFWRSRRSHHEHSIHNLITMSIIRKSGIVLIGPEILWRPRHPISRSDD